MIPYVQKECKICKKYQKIINFRFRKSTQVKIRNYYQNICIECEKEINKLSSREYRKNPEARAIAKKKRKIKYNFEKENNPNFVIKNKANENKYRIKNKCKIKERRKLAIIDRSINPIKKARHLVSGSILKFFKRNGKKKNYSADKFIGYSFHELKQHLENQFEPWMNWDNWKPYDPKMWDDNNPLTWVWNLDHIIPHNYFSYTEPSKESRACWSLENLRPYSAKQNVIEKHNRFEKYPIIKKYCNDIEMIKRLAIYFNETDSKVFPQLVNVK